MNTFEKEQAEENERLHICEQCGSGDSIGDLFVCNVCYRKWLREKE